MFESIKNFFRNLFVTEKPEVTEETTQLQTTPPKGNTLNNIGRYNNTIVNRTETRETDESGNFLTSMLVAEVTDSTLLGYAAGGSLVGAMIGESLHEYSSSAQVSDDSFYGGGGSSGGAGSDGSYDTSTSDSSSSNDYSSSDSSSDYSSSSNSDSSGGSDF